MSVGLTMCNVWTRGMSWVAGRGMASCLVVSTFGLCGLAEAAEDRSERYRTTEAGAVVATPVAMFGSDDRRPLGEREAWLRRNVGLLQQRDTGKLCTAFCVATDAIATAGHCIATALAQGEAGLSEIRYAPDAGGKSNGYAIRGAHGGFARRNVAIGAASLRTRAPINATADWAVLRLEGQACPEGGLPLRETLPTDAATATSSEVYNVSYHRDFGDLALAIAGPCRLAAPDPNAGERELAADFDALAELRLHDCDTGAASSGSPLFTFGPKGGTVVAMNIGTYVRSRIITHDGAVVRRLISETIANTAIDAAILRNAASRLQTD